MQHKSGTLVTTNKITIEDLQNLDELSYQISKVPHYFAGRNETAYSTALIGHYINELVRRVDPKKRSVDTFVEEEINKPLNVEFYFRVTEEVFKKRVAYLYMFPLIKTIYLAVDAYIIEPFRLLMGYEPNKDIDYLKMLLDDSKLMRRGTKIYEKEFIVDLANEYETHSLLLPAATLKTNARSLAKLAALIANEGEIDGIRLLSSETVRKALEKQEPQYDRTLMKNIVRTMGGWGVFDRRSDPENIIGNTNYIGWQGYGGSVHYFNSDKKFGFSYVMNGMGSPHKEIDPRALKMLSTFYELIEKDFNK